MNTAVTEADQKITYLIALDAADLVVITVL